MHPREYSIDVLKKFFFSQTKTFDPTYQPKCWVYLIELYNLIDKAS